MIKQIEKQWAAISIIFITLCGLGFRLYQITGQQLNIDEVTTLGIANHTSAFIVSYSLGHDNNPPLYYLFAHWSSVLLGEYSAFSIRIPAVIFGTLAIPVIYLIGKEIKMRLSDFFLLRWSPLSVPIAGIPRMPGHTASCSWHLPALFGFL